MQIVRLEAENVKRLHAVAIDADGSVVVGGDNEQGKSSVLDAIMYALAGGRSIPARPVHDGADGARVEVTLDNGMVIRREWKGADDKAGRLVVTTADGLKGSQAILDALAGDLTFDPLAFDRMKPAEQAAALSRITGLDVSDIDAEAKRVYDERTEIGRDGKAARGHYDSLPDYPGAEPVDVSDLLRQQEAARESERKADEAGRAMIDAQRAVVDADEDVTEAETQIEKWTKALAERKAIVEEKVLERKAATDNADKARAAIIDAAPIAEAIRTAGEANAKVAANATKAKAAANLEALRVEYDKRSDRLATLAAEKQARIASAAMPVEGMGLTSDGVTIGGIPWEQCSSAQRLEASVAMGFAANPKLRVILVRDGSLLDAPHLARILDLAKQHDGQVWIERVSKGAECSVIIEDGRVAAERSPK